MYFPNFLKPLQFQIITNLGLHYSLSKTFNYTALDVLKLNLDAQII